MLRKGTKDRHVVGRPSEGSLAGGFSGLCGVLGAMVSRFFKEM